MHFARIEHRHRAGLVEVELAADAAALNPAQHDAESVRVVKMAVVLQPKVARFERLESQHAGHCAVPENGVRPH